MEGIFDSHAHYDDHRFDGDRDALLNSLKAKGVGTVLNCGADLEGCRASIALAQQYDFIYAAVGIHPSDADTCDAAAVDALREMTGHAKVVAIGEIGLDYHYLDCDKAQQRLAFLEQMKLAEELGLPIIVHTRDAIADTIACMKDYCGTGVFHCFSETAEVARQLLKKDFYFGFGGVLTFRNARKAVESVQLIPLERLLIETDCPYMAPEPYRGQRNDSSLLTWVVQRMAAIKEVSPEEVIRVTRCNAERLFGIC